jgi:NAD(P)-dependent dehydrogenase (short-subunit alcohol dehydrogenase family)
MSDGILAGKTILVTGAGGGIGSEICREVRRQGGRLVMTDVMSKAESLAHELNARFLALDVTRADDWQRVAAEVDREFGVLHGLVNNAGMILMKPLLDTTLEDYRRINAVNNEGTFLGVRALAPLLARTAHDAQHGTAIVNFSSIYGLGGQPFFTAYCAAKGAIRLLTKAAALEFAQLGMRIRVNSVHPGPIDTALAREPLEALVAAGRIDSMETAIAGVAASYPGGRMGQPNDVAGVVAFLLSDAARFVNGVEIPVDAGFTAKAQ